MKKLIICSMLFFGNIYGSQSDVQSQICLVGSKLGQAAVYPALTFLQVSMFREINYRSGLNCTETESDKVFSSIFVSNLFVTAAALGHNELPTAATTVLVLLGGAINLRTFVQIKRARKAQELQRRKAELKK